MPDRLNALAELLVPNHILLDTKARSKQDVFSIIGDLVDGQHGLSKAQVLNDLTTREKFGSTGLGAGVAIPHARVKGLNQAVAVFLRPHTPIPFEAPDGKPVTDIVVILVPENATGQHLRLLAGVAELFQDESFRAKLGKCKDAASISALFLEFADSRDL